MRKTLLVLWITLLVPFSAFADHHLLPGATQIPYGSYWALGPVARVLMDTPANATAVYAAQNAWQYNNTDIGFRLGGWSGYVSQGDCPSYPFPLVSQIGVFNFVTTQCTATGNNALALAYVDYFITGTRSIAVNLFYVWSNDPNGPAAGHYDLQSVLTHEFGHVFALAHIEPAELCANNQNKPTMSSLFADGGDANNICERTLAPHDIEHANLFCSIDSTSHGKPARFGGLLDKVVA